jgi:hypothetical protein
LQATNNFIDESANTSHRYRVKNALAARKSSLNPGQDLSARIINQVSQHKLDSVFGGTRV